MHRLLAYSHEIMSPAEAGSGLPAGKRQHQPFRIVKLLNQGSPLLLQALATAENLKSVVVDVWVSGIETETKLMTYKVTNARIISSDRMPNRSRVSAILSFEEIAFAYQKIEVTYQPTGATASDDWYGPVL